MVCMMKFKKMIVIVMMIVIEVNKKVKKINHQSFKIILKESEYNIIKK